MRGAVAALVLPLAVLLAGPGAPEARGGSPASPSPSSPSPAASPGDRSAPGLPPQEPILERAVVVASKPFAESYLLAEMMAQLLESRGLDVDRRPGLGATELAVRALRTDGIDVYPEYTGTGLLAVLDQDPAGLGSGEVFRRVAREFHARWGLLWLPPMGFENTYAMAVRRGTADSLNLTTLSDLARVAPELVAGFSPDFIGRADGLPGLREAYGMEFGDVRSLLQAVKYEALAAGRVDVIDGYSTDGAIARWDLVVLEDDRGFFPPYDAAPLVGAALARDVPRALAVLAETAGRFDADLVRRLNRRIEVDGEAVERVARDGLVEVGLVPAGRYGGPGGSPGTEGSGGAPSADASETREPGFLAYLWSRRGELTGMTARHLLLAGGSLLAAILLAVPGGVLLERRRGVAEGVIRGVGVLQTIPGIALLAFMIPLLGIGVVPAMVALFLYSLFPILRNTYSGVRDADPRAVEAGRALGMTEVQILTRIRIPLAAPVIMAGVRTAAVINIGTATLAAFIGAGGLGDPIVSGLALSDVPMILSGAVPAALLAVGVDLGLGWVEVRLTPGGLEETGSRAG